MLERRETIKPLALTDGVLPPFFIVGAPRSGTTLVSRILDSHSRLAVYHESHYYTFFRGEAYRYGDLRESRNLNRLISDFRQVIRMQGFIEPPDVEEFLGALVAPTFEGVLATFLHLHAHRQGKARGGDKTPNHHAYVGEILQRFPHSTVFFVMRDPRDSALAMREKFSASLTGATRLWNDAFRNYQKVSSQVRLVRYEEFIQKPAEMTEALCDTLGEKYEEGMLRFFDRVPGRLAGNPHYRDLLSPVNPALAGRFWTMPQKDVDLVETACAGGMETLGYAFAGRKPAPPPGQKLPRTHPLLERLRYYGTDWNRWRRGCMRWKIVAKLRIRYLLSLGWLR